MLRCPSTAWRSWEGQEWIVIIHFSGANLVFVNVFSVLQISVLTSNILQKVVPYATRSWACLINPNSLAILFWKPGPLQVPPASCKLILQWNSAKATPYPAAHGILPWAYSSQSEFEFLTKLLFHFAALTNVTEQRPCTGICSKLPWRLLSPYNGETNTDLITSHDQIFGVQKRINTVNKPFLGQQGAWCKAKHTHSLQFGSLKTHSLYKKWKI